MSDAPVRYRNTVLYDRGGGKVVGDVFHADGSWTPSKGDEDVAEDIDGSKRLITRSSRIGTPTSPCNSTPAISATVFPFTDGLTKPSSPPRPASRPIMSAWEADALRPK